VLVDERTGQDPIEGLSTWDGFFDKPRDAVPWLVPGVLRKQDVMMLLAGEGGGKTWLTRQFCMCISAGIHPFRPDRYIAPRNTLHIDLENPDDLVAEEGHAIRTQVKQLGGWQPDNAHIWHRPQGLNLRERKHALLLERAIAETEAEVVTLGSLYKSFSRRGDSWDQAAEEVREVFDRIRARYGCAFILEHHMPKGDGGASYDRPQSPFGSQQWIGWCSMGYIINRVGDNMYRLDTFRGSRGKREIPLGLVRGDVLPWSPVWDRDELKYGMWPELQKKLERGEQHR
jgi:RecA-family ATPase